MWKNVFAGLAASLVLTAAGATVESVFARQMWPWQTHFEVSYVLRTASSEAVDVSLKVSADGDEYIIPAAELLGETAGLTAGEYKLVWDSTSSSAPMAAWLKANSGQLAFSVVTAPSASAAEYLVIDLSGGPEAASWPSERITGKPYGGWTTEHRWKICVARTTTRMLELILFAVQSSRHAPRLLKTRAHLAKLSWARLWNHPTTTLVITPRPVNMWI